MEVSEFSASFDDILIFHPGDGLNAFLKSFVLGLNFSSNEDNLLIKSDTSVLAVNTQR